jgi:hypothetical protein
MGISDLDRLSEIAKYANSFGFHFLMDTDTKNSNTGMVINEYGKIRRYPLSQEEVRELTKQGYRPFVPDLIDYHAKKIIEYQEEPLPNRGPKIVKKGHDEFSDEDKDLFYQLAGFKQLKLWESDKFWTEKIDLFLGKFQ